MLVGVAELEEILQTVVHQLHQSCLKKLDFKGEVGLRGVVTLSTDHTAEVAFHTESQALIVESQKPRQDSPTETEKESPLDVEPDASEASQITPQKLPVKKNSPITRSRTNKESPIANSESLKATSESPKATSESPKATSESPKDTPVSPKSILVLPKGASVSPKVSTGKQKDLSSTPVAKKRKREDSDRDYVPGKETTPVRKRGRPRKKIVTTPETTETSENDHTTSLRRSGRKPKKTAKAREATTGSPPPFRSTKRKSFKVDVPLKLSEPLSDSVRPVDLSSPQFEGIALYPISDSQVKLITLPVASGAAADSLQNAQDPVPLEGTKLLSKEEESSTPEDSTPQEDNSTSEKKEMEDNSKEAKNNTDLETKTDDADLSKLGKYMILSVEAPQAKSSKKVLRCDICEIDVVGREALQEHRDTVHAVYVTSSNGKMEKRFVCNICDKHFMSFADLKPHRKNHIKKHLCSYCGKGYSKQCLLNNHILFVHEGTHLCDYCQLGFKSQADYEAHVAKVGCNVKQKCEECGKVYATRNKLQQHISYKHRRQVQCDMCDQMVQARQLKLHKLFHLGVKEFKCDVCTKRFVTAGLLNSHRKMHMEQRRFKCTICQVQFDTQSQVRSHTRIHTGEKPFTCEECGEGFRQVSDLKRHQLRHTGEKPYSCATCGKSYSERSKCLKHILKHHPEVRPFPCRICKEAFFTKKDLEDHTILHVSEPIEVNNEIVTGHDDSALQVAIDSIATHILTVDASVLAEGIEVTSITTQEQEL